MGIRILGLIEEWCPKKYSPPRDNKPFPRRFAVTAWWSWLRSVWSPPLSRSEQGYEKL